MARLQESFGTGKKSSREELVSASGDFLAVVYITFGWDELDIPRWKIPCKQSSPGRKTEKLKAREEFGPGRN